ncbi:xylitol oxidase [Evansella vedderi]|uniref:Xylitol oxidase n=1 Tax=Evansella vedderi TaxID=38282 RepID=A0ABT9ZSU8_9BACI|nr:FAD-binding protein [Evansella vedderi]MDQ0253255.1 xylitol oxidase [Evansella vedderi]
MEEQRNWAGNFKYSAARIHKPESMEQVQQLVARSNKVKVLGTRHSFNAIADTTEDHISLGNLNRVLELDRERRTVTVEGGIQYSDLCQYLHQNGYGLPNMASLPHISVAGACATATHGSGDENHILATSVREMEFVTAKGDVVHFSRDHSPELMGGAAVSLGGLGVVTKLTLDVIPAFQMRQDVYENLPLSNVKGHFEDITSSAYSVSLFTDWREETFNQVWLKHKLTEGISFEEKPEFFGATIATTKVNPVPGSEAVNCTEQLGVTGEWHERLPHFRMDFTPSSGEELQSEYIFPRQHAYDALSAVAQLGEEIAPHLHVSEVRTIAEDDLWMSSCYKQKSVAIHFTWKDDWDSVQKLLPKIEEQLSPFQARPHWGKLFTMEPKHLQGLYEKLPDFQQLLQHYDPQGKFRNKFLDKYIFG